MESSNRLIHESSPYLLQHAHNPVDWYPWGEEALERARRENKPILVSIGYAACHWCHVMERESFEDRDTAGYMNLHFINIKIDREERSDLDHVYMDAVQAMTGSGGWPLNVFLTPEGKPFYGGTYFPPRRAYNRASWREVLEGVEKAFREKREEINAQAENLTDHLEKSNAFGISKPAGDFPAAGMTDDIFAQCMKLADRQWGGFGKAPKFPQTGVIRYLLRYYHVSGNREALEQALLSLDRMLYGGIYDQVGGGFARYSTDTEWLVPHFEKMLYDNALLVSLYSEAFQLTGLQRYRQAVEQTMAFVMRELMSGENGFFAALDADSEGVEGKYYVWSRAEVEELLGADAGLFCEYYDISAEGNWEHVNIPWVRVAPAAFAEKRGLSMGELESLLEKGRRKLLERRSGRIRPLLDDKILLGWNALMNIACSQAYAATGEESWRRLAIANMDFLQRKFRDPGTGRYFHTWKNDRARFPAFLDDYAALIRALLQLLEISGDEKWLEEAEKLCQVVCDDFSETETPFFFYTPENQKDIIVRKKEVYDGATPSGNALMAQNLWHLGILLDRQEWKERSASMLASLGNAIVRYPTSFAVWACQALEMGVGTDEIAVSGTGAGPLHGAILRQYIPHKVIMINKSGGSARPLLAGKAPEGIPTIYLCRNYTCQAPVFSVEELMLLIDRAQKQ